MPSVRCLYGEAVVLCPGHVILLPADDVLEVRSVLLDLRHGRPEDDEVAGLVALPDDVLRVLDRDVGLGRADVERLHAGQAAGNKDSFKPHDHLSIS